MGRGRFRRFKGWSEEGKEEEIELERGEREMKNEK